MKYKISYVVLGERGGGAIINATKRPKTGTEVLIGEHTYIVQEVTEIMSRGDFVFLQATVLPMEKVKEPSE